MGAVAAEGFAMGVLIGGGFAAGLSPAIELARPGKRAPTVEKIGATELLGWPTPTMLQQADRAPADL
jgi:hypothetical protein